MTPVEAAAHFGGLLDKHGIAYATSGSVAALFYGAERSTIDIDLGVAAELDGLQSMVSELSADEFYVPHASMLSAVELTSSFNILHNRSPLKIDFFVLGDGILDRRLIEHRVRFDSKYGPIWVSSALDIAVRKLWWFDKTDRTSQRQWEDVLALLRGGHVEPADFVELAEKVSLADIAKLAVEQAREGR